MIIVKSWSGREKTCDIPSGYSIRSVEEVEVTSMTEHEEHFRDNYSHTDRFEVEQCILNEQKDFPERAGHD